MSHIVAELVRGGVVRRRVTVSAEGSGPEACRAMVAGGWERAEGVTGTFSCAWTHPERPGAECWLRKVEAVENHAALVDSARLANLS